MRERQVLSPGALLDDRFEIIALLGQGNFGEVYQAYQLIFGHRVRQVAIKLFDESKVDANSYHDLFGDVVTLIGLQEEDPPPGVAEHMIQIYDMGIVHTPSHRAFMSMKILPKTFQSEVRRFRDGGMPVQTTVNYLRELLIPLSWMHSLDPAVVHADLKPDNVLMTARGGLVLTDFGLAARMPLGSVGGAIAYQAPETLLGERAGPAFDVYGLGLIWYEMCTGKHPFDEADLVARAQGGTESCVSAHREARKWPMKGKAEAKEGDCRIVPPSELNEEMQEHPQLEEILRRCLAYWPTDRYPNASSVLRQIDEYLATGRIKLPPVESGTGDEKGVLHPKDLDALLQDARAYLQRHGFEDALRIAGNVLEQGGRDLSAMKVKVCALLGLGRNDEALQVWTQARKLVKPGHKESEVIEMEIAYRECLSGQEATLKNLRDEVEKLRRTQKR